MVLRFVDITNVNVNVVYLVWLVYQFLSPAVCLSPYTKMLTFFILFVYLCCEKKLSSFDIFTILGVPKLAFWTEG